MSCENIPMALFLVRDGLSQHTSRHPGLAQKFDLDDVTCAAINPSRTRNNTMCMSPPVMTASTHIETCAHERALFLGESLDSLEELGSIIWDEVFCLRLLHSDRTTQIDELSNTAGQVHQGVLAEAIVQCLVRTVHSAVTKINRLRQ